MKHEELQFIILTVLRARDIDTFTDLVSNTPLIDIAEALNGQPHKLVADFLVLLPPNLRSALFTHFSAKLQDALLTLLPHTVVVLLFEQLPSDERADIFNRLNEKERALLLPALASVEREDILKLAAYPEGSVGSVMSSNYATVSIALKASEALTALRESKVSQTAVNVVYVLDEARKLLGTISLSDLVMAAPDTLLNELIQREPVFIRVNAAAKDAAEMVRRYDLLALPVVNEQLQMLGIVTVDDAMDIEKTHDASQLAKFGGTAVSDGPDLSIRESSLGQMFKVRVFWLAILTFFGVITSTFVAHQEELLSEVIILAAFIAPIVDMGGNTGSQSATLVIRAMALGEVRLSWKDIWFVLKRELPVALMLGIVIAVLEAILAYFSKGIGINILLVVGLSMLVCTALGGVFGALLPFAARRIGTDPATLSSPLITSIMDLLGVFVYFGFAYIFLGDLLIATP